MNGFFLTIGPERLKKTTAIRAKKLVGVMVDDSFIQPACCEKCGGHLEIGDDWEEGTVSCGDCGNECRIFRYDENPVRI